MSLTSYRAAPPRVKVVDGWIVKKGRSGEDTHPFCRPGGDLLSRALRRSTIGPGGLNDRVRNGIGWGPSGIATRSTKRMDRRHQNLGKHTRRFMSFAEERSSRSSD